MRRSLVKRWWKFTAAKSVTPPAQSNINYFRMQMARRAQKALTTLQVSSLVCLREWSCLGRREAIVCASERSLIPAAVFVFILQRRRLAFRRQRQWLQIHSGAAIAMYLCGGAGICAVWVLQCSSAAIAIFICMCIFCWRPASTHAHMGRRALSKCGAHASILLAQRPFVPDTLCANCSA